MARARLREIRETIRARFGCPRRSFRSRGCKNRANSMQRGHGKHERRNSIAIEAAAAVAAGAQYVRSGDGSPSRRRVKVIRR